MNAFPPELLHHHFACMVVAGLTAPSKPSPSPASSSSATPPDPASVEPPADHPTRVFPDLTKSLHDILSARARNTLWDPSRGRAAVFHTIFADHLIRLPPLKTKPSARHVSPIAHVTSGSTVAPSEASSAAFAALPPRSPLSPLHPNSPQFPDGLIAPVWVRKHRELVPAVFVSFHCLPTPSEAHANPDDVLIKTISDRRRSLAERGIKLTIVLLTEREKLEDPALEARLSVIRRSSALDTRASLFVLTPVAKGELVEFVASLHSALFEPAADYYREHARRVKRKRTRYPPPPSTLQPIVNALSTLPPPPNEGQKVAAAIGLNDISWLSREGWIVRSEYKLAVFAELAGDMHEALVRYREAYDLLCNSPSCLLGSTLMLPPRTKRWAEAKVLADTLSIRVCKLLLYADDGAAAASFFRRHLARFTELSTGWGIGSMTFEYWSWLSKQYRLFGELIEHATRAHPGSPLPPFQLPAHAPPLPSKLMHPAAVTRFTDARGEVHPPPTLLLPNQNAVAVSTLPNATLSSPATYLYLAALCTVERRTRFLRISSLPSDEGEDASSPLSHERKVDHAAQLIEALTRAYDAFKKERHHRAALFVAARLATAYVDAGNDEMALKFLERILRSYKKDQVEEVSAALVDTAVHAAGRVRDGAAAVRLLVEVLDPSLPVKRERRTELVDALTSVLGEEGEGEAVTVSAGFVDVAAVFPAAQVDFGCQVPFQVCLRNTSGIDLNDVLSVQRATLHIESGDGQKTLIELTPSDSPTPSQPRKPVIVDLGTLDSDTSTTADIAAVFTEGGIVAVQGAFTPTHAGAVRVSKVSLYAQTKGGLAVQLDLPLPERNSHAAETSEPSSSGLNVGQWLLASGRTMAVTQRADPSTTLVQAHRVNVSLFPTSPTSASGVEGFVDERIPLTLILTNHEKTRVRAWVDAALQPSYDGAKDTLTLDRSHPADANAKAKAIKGIPAGTVDAGKQVQVTVWLTPKGRGGGRVVDFALRVGDEYDEQRQVTATRSLAVKVEELFAASAWTKSLSPEAGRGRGKALLDFTNDDGEEEEKGRLRVGLDILLFAENVVDGVEVDAVDLVTDSEEKVGQVEHEDEQKEALGQWLPHDRFTFTRLLSSPFSSSAALFWRVAWTRSPGSPNYTLIPITTPTPSPVGQQTGLTITLTYPPLQTLHQPCSLGVEIENHHPSRSHSLTLMLDSDDNWTASRSRRISIPHLLPLQHKVIENFATLVPQTIGKVTLPNVNVRLIDPQAQPGAEATILTVNSNDRRHTEAAEEDEEEVKVRFMYSRAGGGEREEVKDGMPLPRVLVRL